MLGSVGRLASSARLVALPLAIALAIALPTSLSYAAPLAIQTTEYCADEEERAFLELINAYRAEHGVGPLVMSQALGAAAETHSLDMAATGYFDHTMSDGSSVAQNLRNHGYTGRTYGENITAGVETADAAFSMWRNSSAHNENMLRSAYTAIGIGRAQAPGSGYGWYWTTIFGGTVDAPAVLCGQASTAPTAPGTLDGNALATDALNLRSGPGTGYALLGSVPAGSRLEVTGEAQSGYYPVTYRGESGWVLADLVVVDALASNPASDDEPPSVAGDNAVATTIDDVYLRSGPTRDAPFVTTIPAGSPVALSGSADGGYLGVVYNGTSGWVDAAYLDVDQSADPAAQPVPEPVPGTTETATTTAELNLRAGPVPNAAILLVIPAGSPVTLTGEASGGYLGVSYNGTTGWADAAYLA